MSENVIEVESRYDCHFLSQWDEVHQCIHPQGPMLCGEQKEGPDAIPPDCPLRKGPVVVKLKEADDD